ncbi:peptidase M15 family protein [filamentous cyanobacterium CCP5]|nr:peptidase M15 family protein [filamentous cyanobacterium CCP5]
MHIQVKSDTYFKLKPLPSDQLGESERVLVRNGTEFDIQYYIDIGSNHWQIELVEPTLGDQKTTVWYLYEPDIRLKSPITLKVTSDTLFKTEPKISSDLSDDQKIFVGNGAEFEVASYLPAAGGHVKVALASENLGPKKLNTWYVYQPDVKIEGTRRELKVISDTLFKAKPTLSSELSADEKIFVKTGSVFELNSFAEAGTYHVKVALEGAFLGPKNLTTWYAYTPDIRINGNESGNQPNETAPVTQPATPKDPGKALRFPGFTGVYYTNHPIIRTTVHGEPGNFTWGEATRNGTRIPENANVVYGILRVCKALEDIRHNYGGRTMTINSWYRPPAVNRAVRGASNSRHLVGDAADFVIAGVHPFDVYAKLNRWWGGRGGLASATNFTHIDTRGIWARWKY